MRLKSLSSQAASDLSRSSKIVRSLCSNSLTSEELIAVVFLSQNELAHMLHRSTSA